MKRVLIITYYWPPSGGSGVQRWLKFAKYLPENGWQPVIYCPEDADYTVIDESLSKDIPKEAEIIKGPIFEPYRFFRKITGQKEVIGTGLSSTGGKEKSGSFLKKLMIWVRGNLFIPDARMFWIKPSIRRLAKYLAENPVDAIVSTGPPHSCHLIALGLKKKFPQLKWITDFRDPWSDIFYKDELLITKQTQNRINKKEKEVLEYCDKVVVVTPTMVEDFRKLTDTSISLITNGYDEDDYKKIDLNSSDKFIISYIGTLMPSQYSSAFWQALYDVILNNTQKKIEIRLIGNIDQSLYNNLCEIGLKKWINHIPYIEHAKISKYQAESNALILFINNTVNGKGILTGKLFEYLAVKRPIVCISPKDSDAQKIIDECKAGKCFSYTSKKEIFNYLSELVDGNFNLNIDISITNFSRRQLAMEMAKTLEF